MLPIRLYMDDRQQSEGERAIERERTLGRNLLLVASYLLVLALIAVRYQG